MGNSGVAEKISVLLLAAGFGTRLRPFTNNLPKCLIPIKGKALLEIWLDNLESVGIGRVLVNLHAHDDQVKAFVSRPKYQQWVKSVYEPKLLGTAGTLRENRAFLGSKTILLAHADNLCLCDFRRFLEYHLTLRPQNTLITMMTFVSPTPQSCGIVELDEYGVVTAFHEKVDNPPGDLANAAIYLLAPEVIEWIADRPQISDFSTEVLPFFLGKIATWKNVGIMRDIGTPSSWAEAQGEVDAESIGSLCDDQWQKEYAENPIHSQLSDLLRKM